MKTLLKFTELGIKIFFLLTFAIFTSTCSDDSRFKKKFEANRSQFSELVKYFSDYHFPADISIDQTSLPDSIKEIILELGVEKITLNKTTCPTIIEYEFCTDWSRTEKLYISYDICTKEQTKEDYHSNFNQVEIWGLGNNWTMWLDHDFI